MITLASPLLTAGITPHGARLARLSAPDRDGRPAQVVLGLPEPSYADDTAYLGATAGRVANRIAGGRFTLDGHEHVIPCNERNAALHGGPHGFDHADWEAGPVLDVDGGQAVTLRHVSPDGDNGFPGTLSVAVTYTVSGADVRIDMTAETDAPTVVNLTHHSYFTLAGAPADVSALTVAVHADRYLPVDEDLIPTGELAPVAGTSFDLREPVVLGDRAFDHTWVLAEHAQDDLREAAHVVEPASGRTLTVLTDQPGVQFYTGTMLDGTLALDGGGTARRGEAFCLEPQHFPDSPNRPEFPSVVLRPGETRRTRILLRFGVDESTGRADSDRANHAVTGNESGYAGDTTTEQRSTR